MCQRLKAMIFHRQHNKQTQNKLGFKKREKKSVFSWQLYNNIIDDNVAQPRKFVHLIENHDIGFCSTQFNSFKKIPHTQVTLRAQSSQSIFALKLSS